jgi:hypothetical protein
MSNKSRDVIFQKTKTLRGAPQPRQRLGSTICRYLPLIDRSSAAICRYLIFICRYLLLIVINWRYLPLTLSKIRSPKGLPKGSGNRCAV